MDRKSLISDDTEESDVLTGDGTGRLCRWPVLTGDGTGRLCWWPVLTGDGTGGLCWWPVLTGGDGTGWTVLVAWDVCASWENVESRIGNDQVWMLTS